MRFATTTLLLASAFAALATSAHAQPQGQSGHICVYLFPNFGGQATCFPVGQRIQNVGSQLNDRIKSVQVPQGARATLCGDINLTGSCVTVDRPVQDTASLGGAAGISSLTSEGAGGGRAGGPQQQPERGRGQPQFGGQQPLPPQGSPPRGPQFGGLPPGMVGGDRSDGRREMFRLRRACEDGDTRACVQYGIIIGENRERRAQWKRENPELFWWEQ